MLIKFYLTDGQRDGSKCYSNGWRGVVESRANSIVSPQKGLCLELEDTRTLGRGAYLRTSPKDLEQYFSNPNVPTSHLGTVVTSDSVSLGLDGPEILYF